MKIKNEIEASRSSYAEQWYFTSNFYNDKEYYKSFAKWIPEHSSVLEIGCGSGFGTVEISKRCFKMHSIDENPICLEKTKFLLDSNKKSFEVVFRGSILEDHDNISYQVNYSPISINKNQNLLIEGNIVSDGHLRKWLKGETYDIITAWMIGFHQMIHTSDDLELYFQNNNRTPEETRELKYSILKAISNAGVTSLSENGMIYLIERVNDQAYDKDMLEAILNIYKDTLSNYELEHYELMEGELKTKMNMIDGMKITKPTKMNFLKMMFKKKTNVLY